jgi:heterodisulfide reductase subunit A-like polyferredoxin
VEINLLRIKANKRIRVMTLTEVKQIKGNAGD